MYKIVVAVRAMLVVGRAVVAVFPTTWAVVGLQVVRHLVLRGTWAALNARMMQVEQLMECLVPAEEHA